MATFRTLFKSDSAGRDRLVVPGLSVRSFQEEHIREKKSVCITCNSECYSFTYRDGREYFAKVLIRSTDCSKLTLRELRAHALLQHFAIQPLVGLFRSRDARLVAVFPLCELDLEKYLQGEGPGGIPEKTARKIALKMLLALQHAHKHGIAHRDLKAANVLLQDGGTVLLTDFGAAAGGRHAGSHVGTPGFMPPEQQPGATYDAYKVDYWLLGMLLLQIAAGPIISTWQANQWTTAGTQCAIGDAIHGQEHLSPELRSLLVALLQREPDRRMTVDDVLGHAWLQHPSLDSMRKDYEELEAMAPEPPDAQTDAAFCAHVQQLIQEVRVRRAVLEDEAQSRQRRHAAVWASLCWLVNSCITCATSLVVASLCSLLLCFLLAQGQVHQISLKHFLQGASLLTGLDLLLFRWLSAAAHSSHFSHQARQAWQPIAQLPASRLATVPEEVPDSEHEEVNEDTFHEALEAAHDTLPDAANATADIIRTHGADQTPADMSKSASAAEGLQGEQPTLSLDLQPQTGGEGVQADVGDDGSIPAVYPHAASPGAGHPGHVNHAPAMSLDTPSNQQSSGVHGSPEHASNTPRPSAQPAGDPAQAQEQHCCAEKQATGRNYEAQMPPGTAAAGQPGDQQPQDCPLTRGEKPSGAGNQSTSIRPGCHTAGRADVRKLAAASMDQHVSSGAEHAHAAPGVQPVAAADLQRLGHDSACQPAETAPDGLVEAARQAAQAGVASDKDSGEEEVEEAAASPNAHTVEPAPLSHDATQQHAAQGSRRGMQPLVSFPAAKMSGASHVFRHRKHPPGSSGELQESSRQQAGAEDTIPALLPGRCGTGGSAGAAEPQLTARAASSGPHSYDRRPTIHLSADARAFLFPEEQRQSNLQSHLDWPGPNGRHDSGMAGAVIKRGNAEADRSSSRWQGQEHVGQAHGSHNASDRAGAAQHSSGAGAGAGAEVANSAEDMQSEPDGDLQAMSHDAASQPAQTWHGDRPEIDTDPADIAGPQSTAGRQVEALAAAQPANSAARVSHSASTSGSSSSGGNNSTSASQGARAGQRRRGRGRRTAQQEQGTQAPGQRMTRSRAAPRPAGEPQAAQLQPDRGIVSQTLPHMQPSMAHPRPPAAHPHGRTGLADALIASAPDLARLPAPFRPAAVGIQAPINSNQVAGIALAGSQLMLPSFAIAGGASVGSAAGPAVRSHALSAPSQGRNRGFATHRSLQVPDVSADPASVLHGHHSNASNPPDIAPRAAVRTQTTTASDHAHEQLPAPATSSSGVSGANMSHSMTDIQRKALQEANKWNAPSSHKVAFVNACFTEVKMATSSGANASFSCNFCGSSISVAGGPNRKQKIVSKVLTHVMNLCPHTLGQPIREAAVDVRNARR